MDCQDSDAKRETNNVLGENSYTSVVLSIGMMIEESEVVVAEDQKFEYRWIPIKIAFYRKFVKKICEESAPRITTKDLLNELFSAHG